MITAIQGRTGMKSVVFASRFRGNVNVTPYRRRLIHMINCDVYRVSISFAMCLHEHLASPDDFGNIFNQVVSQNVKNSAICHACGDCGRDISKEVKTSEFFCCQWREF
eukprot:Protomagalhaensia_wolfi_Nauph_80__3095@NODE_3166_length_867_cov_3_455314_g2481_i0_p2_GENE_NODE_3166_length_867_cov_3_455314_g2481_i0NODE_3166_length_867_cov_3_455314_g2481_i0_p2_ORF_typecomplete_len108_score3_61Ta0938/PF11494_8/3_1e03Ta0938/PF11494_8/2e03Ta0938/PF11494_8/0_49_NODE_3166_length_867_cov_3_455314_g2481_i0423746